MKTDEEKKEGEIGHTGGDGDRPDHIGGEPPRKIAGNQTEAGEGGKKTYQKDRQRPIYPGVA